jgi:hypothetical protein
MMPPQVGRREHDPMLAGVIGLFNMNASTL